MSLSALQKFILPPAIASAAVFGALTVPLAILGDQQVAINIQEEPSFHGKLRDIATPYVIFATALSLGAGLSAAAVNGWRHSARKSASIEEQLSSLEQHLQEKELLLKELKVSESRLQASGLGSFLDNGLPFEANALVNSQNGNVSQPVVVQASAAVIQAPAPAVSANTKFQVDSESKQPTPAQIYQVYTSANEPQANSKPARPALPYSVNDRSPSSVTASAFPSAQTYFGYSQSNKSHQQISPAQMQVHQTSIVAEEFEQLQNQLREMMAQMRVMQQALQQTPEESKTQEKVASNFKVYYDYKTSS